MLKGKMCSSQPTLKIFPLCRQNAVSDDIVRKWLKVLKWGNFSFENDEPAQRKNGKGSCVPNPGIDFFLMQYQIITRWMESIVQKVLYIII